MLRRAFAVTFMVSVLAVGALGQKPNSKNATLRPKGREAGVATIWSLQPILEVLNKAKLSGSLEFSGSCDSLAPTDFPDFPQVRTPVTSGGTPLQTLREIFAGDPAMQVSQDPNGTVRMIEKGVPIDIMSVRIDHILFGDKDKGGYTYSANGALSIILSSPEIQSCMKAHDATDSLSNSGPISILSCVGVCTIPAWVPHIEGGLDNVTLPEAMDRVFKTFPGIWIYQNCPRSEYAKRKVYFRYYHLQDTISGVIVE